MEPVNLDYSTKNIPIASPKEYLKCLVDNTESFPRRARWKAYCFLNPCDPTNKQTFGFNTTTLGFVHFYIISRHRYEMNTFNV